MDTGPGQPVIERNPARVDRQVGQRTVLVAAVVSIAGHVVHNLEEFPLAVLVGWETLVPVGVTVLLVAWLLGRPGRSASLATAGWALLVIVVGGGSVLPLPIWPFVPAQTVSHYAAHVVYALTQVPLLWVAVRSLQRRESTGEASAGPLGQ